MTQIQVSIIVPVYNGQKTLDLCIKSLLIQGYPKQKYEVIVIDNNSTDNTKQIICNYPVIYAFESKKGSYAARNKGIGLARGEIILFTDSDCVVDYNWIEKMIENLRDPKIGAVGGKVLAYHPSTSVEKYLDVIGALDNKTSINSKNPSIATANAGIRKQVLEEVNYFDDSFISGGDYDITWRISQLDYKIEYANEAIIYHIHPSNLKSLFKKEFRYGHGNVKLFKRHSDKNRFRLMVYIKILEFTIRIPLRLITSLFVAKEDKTLYIMTPVCDLVRSLGYKCGMIYGCVIHRTIYL